MDDDKNKTETLLVYMWQLRAQLDDARGVIDAAIEAHGERREEPPGAGSNVVPIGLPPRSEAVSDAQRARHRALRATISDFFRSAPHRDRQPAMHGREICFARCTGLTALSRLVGWPLLVPVIGMVGGVRARVREYRAVGYGAGWMAGTELRLDPHGFDDWAPARIRPRAGPSPGSPVVVTDVSLTVPLPDGLSWRKFDLAVHQRVCRDSLFAWIATEAGRSHCAALGVDPAMAQRYTVHPGGVVPRPSPAVDICMLDAHGGVDLAIAIVEDVLLEHVLLGLALED